jgi:hypothetical protein
MTSIRNAIETFRTSLLARRPPGGAYWNSFAAVFTVSITP